MPKRRRPNPAAIPKQPIDIKTNKNVENIAEEQDAKERALDETIAGTFPASDPLSSDPNPVPDEEEGRLAS